ncbi:hypothetical protein CEXT_446981, partial [Caerostris extrusa]
NEKRNSGQGILNSNCAIHELLPLYHRHCALGWTAALWFGHSEICFEKTLLQTSIMISLFSFTGMIQEPIPSFPKPVQTCQTSQPPASSDLEAL